MRAGPAPERGRWGLRCHIRPPRGAAVDGRAPGSGASPRPSGQDGWRRSWSDFAAHPLVIVDEVGYIPFDPDAAALFFSLISSRYERASLIVSSNKSLSAWAEIFGDATAVEAMVDRLVNQAEVILLQSESYRLKDRAKVVR